jgi:hypothetical protein
MVDTIENVIGEREAQELRSDFNDVLMNGGSYGDVEDLLLGYGLETDYVEQLFCI